MDLKQYFKKVKETEASLSDDYLLMVSTDTPDGGKAGAMIEVSRQLAAKAIVDGWAIFASEEQKTAHLEEQAAKRKSIDTAQKAHRLQVSIVSEPEFRQMGKGRSKESLPERAK
jgi:hypothetical protein